MRTIVLIFALCLFGNAFTQTSELTITIKTFDVVDDHGTQVPYIDYIDNNGQFQRFSFALPKVGADEYAEIMIDDALLIKVESASDYGEFVLIESYEFHEDVAKALIGKKVHIKYDKVDSNNYLNSISKLD